MTDELKIISDDRIAGSQDKLAASGARSSEALTRTAEAMSRLATLDLVPRADHDVWLQIACVRAGLANNDYAKLSAVLAYADAFLAETRKRFPLGAAPAPSPPPSAPTPAPVPAPPAPTPAAPAPPVIVVPPAPLPPVPPISVKP
jgi:hypothetical protein